MVMPHEVKCRTIYRGAKRTACKSTRERALAKDRTPYLDDIHSRTHNNLERSGKSENMPDVVDTVSSRSKPQVGKAIYTAKTRTAGGRENGVARSSDGRLDIILSTPGGPGAGTNPEQLFAAGWSACFEGAMGRAARRMKIVLPADLVIDAEVDLCLSEGAFFLQARLNVSLPGLERETARILAGAAHQTCPYSKAISGNIDVAINLV